MTERRSGSDERREVSRPDGQSVSDPQVEAIQALEEGLSSARTVVTDPMSHARAVQLLEETITAL